MLGSEFSKSDGFSPFEKAYIAALGMPILGMRIRAWWMLPLIRRHIVAAKTVLDVGSGRGVFTIEIAKALPNAEVLGVDFDAKKAGAANELAKKIGLNNLSFEAVDIFDRKFTKKYDCVIAIDVLEHIENDAQAAGNIYGLLNDGGRIIVHVPHMTRNLFGMEKKNFDIEGHVRDGYHLDGLETLLRGAGFDVIDRGYTYSSFETLANDISYLITEGREKRKALYSLAFPFLLALAALGRGVKPKVGSGVYMIGEKKK